MTNWTQLVNSITPAAKTLGTEFITILWHIGLAVLALILGLYLSRFVNTYVKKVLNKIDFDNRTSKIGINEMCVRFGFGKSPTYILAFILSWVVMIIAIIYAAKALNLNEVQVLLEKFLAFLPKLFVSILILFGGLIFGKFLGNIIENSSKANNLSGGFIVARGVDAFIVLFSALLALENLGMATRLVNNVILVLLASMGLAFGIAVGLGSKDIVAEFLKKTFDKNKK
ncbi:hypothetical protein Emin_1308 [Elusimicrobium minutum Pei191]|uniref:Uncharacterized protein n=1 Tax=Elusimicrobium minutum (strain Pei191) TaxID=445932 RepID=B2KEB2_ELUMP|nr:hypothetical protein [Elusimicrobium minutum]ACC98858.1 hypothetical protein Emin_1308 [Elusimicrobium minutum Pei191]